MILFTKKRVCDIIQTTEINSCCWVGVTESIENESFDAFS